MSNCSAGERIINDGDQFVLAGNGSNVVTDAYGYYPGGDQPMSLQLPSGRTGVFVTDPQLRGTVRAIADADKNATNPEFKTYAVSPWGEVAADTDSITRLRLAGQQYDQGSRLYYLRARYYDPQLGRFLSEDPIGISGGLNLYAYAGNDPVNMWDPSGTSGMGPGSSCVHTGEPCELPDIDVPNPPNDIVTIARGVGFIPRVYPGTTGSNKGGGPSGGDGGGIKLTQCQRALVTTAVDLVLDLTFLKLARSLERSGTALIRAADRGLHPMLTSTKPYLEVIQTQPLAGSLALMGGNFMHGAHVAETVEHSMAGAGVLIGAADGGISWDTVKDGVKLAAGFLPGVGGGVVDLAVNGYDVVTNCF